MTQAASTPIAAAFDPQTAKGLSVDLYYGSYQSMNCAWNVPNGRPRSVTIVAIRDETTATRGHVAALRPVPRDWQASTPQPGDTAAVLVKRNIGRVIWHVEPLTPPEAGRTPFMSGGCYAGTSDSRLGEVTGVYGAVPVHDYSETWAAYRAMTVD